MVRLEPEVSSWLDRPLCRRYRLGVFDAARLRLRATSVHQEVVVHWRIGWLPDGGLELLGAWIRCGGRLQTQLRILADLDRRGVERVWHAIARWGEGHTPAALASSPPWPSLEQVQVFEQRTAGQIRRQVARYLNLDGDFESGPAVLRRVALALQRAKRRMLHDRLAGVEQPDRESSVHDGVRSLRAGHGNLSERPDDR